MDLEDAILAAGEGGTIRRDSWPMGAFLIIANLRVEGRTITLKVGGWRPGTGFHINPPSNADKAAHDWTVVAKAVPMKRKPALRLVTFEGQ